MICVVAFSSVGAVTDVGCVEESLGVRSVDGEATVVVSAVGMNDAPVTMVDTVVAGVVGRDVAVVIVLVIVIVDVIVVVVDDVVLVEEIVLVVDKSGRGCRGETV